MKKILVLGANGLLGYHVSSALASKEYDLTIAAKSKSNYLAIDDFIYLDATNRDVFFEEIAKQNWTHIVNCIAYTAVDKAEDEAELAEEINHRFPQELADFSAKRSIHLIHVSTDYVFDGRSGPYTEDDRTNPLSVYGRTKLNGDLAIQNQKKLYYTIFRAIVVYGAHADAKKLNFVSWLIQELEAKRSVRIVNDQFGNFSFVNDLVFAIIEAIEEKREGLFNLASQEMMSRYEMALRIASVLKLDSSLIQAVSSSEFKQAAGRPLKSGLVVEKFMNFFHIPITPFDESIRIMYRELK